MNTNSQTYTQACAKIWETCGKLGRYWDVVYDQTLGTTLANLKTFSKYTFNLCVCVYLDNFFLKI